MSEPIIYETTIDGKTARASIPPPDRPGANYTKKDYDEIARQAFALMDPRFDQDQEIREIKL